MNFDSDSSITISMTVRYNSLIGEYFYYGFQAWFQTFSSINQGKTPHLKTKRNFMS